MPKQHFPTLCRQLCRRITVHVEMRRRLERTVVGQYDLIVELEEEIRDLEKQLRR
jgi:hypothetical protein